MNRGQARLEAAAQGLVLVQGLLADALALEMVPDELAGVELRDIAREPMQLGTVPKGKPKSGPLAAAHSSVAATPTTVTATRNRPTMSGQTNRRYLS